MTKLNQIHAYDDGEIYAEAKGSEFYLAVRFLDDADFSIVKVFRWIGEDAPTASDSLIKSGSQWDFFTTFELTDIDRGVGEINWEAYEIDLEDAIDI